MYGSSVKLDVLKLDTSITTSIKPDRIPFVRIISLQYKILLQRLVI